MLDNFGNSKPVPMEKYDRIGRVTVRKAYFGGKANVVSGQPFTCAEETT